MPKFLSKSEIYNIIQRELPENTYATTRKPQEFYTTSDDDAVAKVFESIYQLSERIYDNYWPQSAVEKLSDWEVFVFGEVDDTNATIAERRDRILTKIRSRKGITVQDIIDIVYTVIGSDKNVEIIEKGCESGVWILGKSRLSRSTFLGISSVQGGVTIPSDFDPCMQDPSEIGLTPEELKQLQDQAYSYEVRIIGYDATEQEREKLDFELTRFEPARSAHKIDSPFVPVVIKEKWKLSRSKLGSRTYLG